MKLIVAYIQPEALTKVKQALFEQEIFRMSVTNALGCGQQKGYHESYRGADIEVNLLKKTRIEIAVNEDYVKKTIDAVVAGARTGKIGDGKIIVLDITECVRIRTGETGEEAIEVIIAAKAEGDDRILYEMADMLYHSLVLISARGLSWQDLESELEKRF